jgi:hypothetical protein
MPHVSSFQPVKKTIIFPLHLPSAPVKLHVSPHQSVSAGDLLASYQNHSLFDLHIDKALSLPIQKIFPLLKRQLGEQVNQGEILADKKTLFGHQQFVSPHTGTLTLTSDQRLALLVPGVVNRITAPAAGEIRDINASQITLATRAWEIPGRWGVGDQAQGPLILLSAQDFSDLTLGQFAGNLNQSLGVITFSLDPSTYNKLAALGNPGIFCYHIDPYLKADLATSSPSGPVLVESQIELDQFPFSLNPSPPGWLFGDQKRLLIFQN